MFGHMDSEEVEPMGQSEAAEGVATASGGLLMS